MYAPLPMSFFFFSLHPQDLDSEDVPGVLADDEDPAPNAVLPLLEQYPLNTTLGIGEPLTSDEVARGCLHVLRASPSRSANRMQGVGVLATQLVSESDTPLQTLRQLAHDFPKYAASLSRRVVVQSGLLQEVASNSRKIQPGVSAVWLNGVQLSPDDMNPHR
jgi:UDP-glucose:glycoprotein glucosyltransferase